MSNVSKAILSACKVLHIGANTGQEASLYETNGIKAWHVEAVPDIYKELQENLKGMPNQFALKKCLSSTSGLSVIFNVANNGGQSSSLFDLGRHKSSYPMVEYTHSIELTTSTIDEIVANGEVDEDFDFLLIDAQGAELEILTGAQKTLSKGYIKKALIEISVEPIYNGGASYLDVCSYLRNQGLYLREAVFNNEGWTDALFERVYWPTSPPEVESNGINIAPFADLTQSSARVIDPPTKMTGIRTGGYCFHTDEEDQPWIRLDFPSPVEFNEIVVFNRCNGSRERATNLNIYTSMDSENWDLICENRTPFGGLDWPGPLRVKHSSKAKSFLFKLRERNYLHFDQIEIYSPN